MDSSKIFARSNSPLTADVDDEVIMLNPATSDYFGLAGVGARIWELCAEPQTIDGLVAMLVEEYDVEVATCSAEVRAFVADLESSGLVTFEPLP
jgi:hypothetical protein